MKRVFSVCLLSDSYERPVEICKESCALGTLEVNNNNCIALQVHKCLGPTKKNVKKKTNQLNSHIENKAKNLLNSHMENKAKKKQSLIKSQRKKRKKYLE